MLTKDYNSVIKPYLDKCWKNPLNVKLLDEYIKMSTTLNVAPNIASKLTCPYLSFLGPNYKDDYSGTFIIGQETKECENKKRNIFTYQDFCDFQPSKGDDCREKIMMETQAEFVINDFGDKKRGFFSVVPKIAGCKGTDFLDSNFVWDELIAFAYNKKGYKKITSKYDNGKEAKEAIFYFSKAKLEIDFKIAKPKYAIFLISEYKSDLKEMFVNLQMRPTACHDVETCDLYGTKCFVTIHPHDTSTTQKEIWAFLAEEIKK